MSNVAEALAHLVTVYVDNDPARSLSGSERGLGVRQGRRDCAVATVAVLMGVTYREAQAALDGLAADRVCTR